MWYLFYLGFFILTSQFAPAQFSYTYNTFFATLYKNIQNVIKNIFIEINSPLFLFNFKNIFFDVI